MSKNLYLNIDDDITRAMRKIAREPSDDITLVLPKGSLLFSDLINLKLMKAETDTLGKTISVLTMDPKGQQRAQEAGFELKDFSVLRREGPSGDMAMRPRKPFPVRPVQKVVQKKVEPIPIQVEPIPTSYQPIQQHPPVIQLPSERKKKTGFFKRIFRKTLFASALAVILMIAVLAGFLLPQATITVYASPKPIQRDLDITLDQNFAKPSTEQLTLPAKIFSSPEQQTRQFQTAGTVDLGNKAHGQVQIYNFTGQTLKLKAATTTLVSGSKVFHLTADLSGIKPTKLQANGKDPDPSTLIAPVEVIADQGGQQYNLAPGTRLDISNQILGSNPSQLYALSLSQFLGGASRLTSVITQKDLDDATKQLNDSIIDSANQQLMSLQSMTIIPTGAKLDSVNVSFDKKVGEQSMTFFGTVSGNIKALVYNPEQLKQIIEQRVKITLDEDKTLDTGEKETIQAKFKTLDLDNGKGVLSVHFQSSVQTDLSQSRIAKEVKGKGADDTKSTVMSKDGVSNVEIKYFPFWVKTTPKIPGRIKVIVKNP